MHENSRKGYQEEEAAAKQQEELNGMKMEKLITNKELGARRKWSSLTRNPRIVRVSQTVLGGKDRHSKVYTIRGLRDRRIRLSVPTAIQLYDLQHKLGLSQPSKVVDWLLDVTKSDIDKLPPLDQYFLSHNNNYQQQQTLVLPPPQPAAAGTSFSLGAGNHHHHQNLMAKSILLDNSSRLKGKEVDHIIEKGKYWWWMKTNDQEENHPHHKLFSNSSISTDAAITTTYNNSSYNIMEYPSSTLSLSQFGGHATSSSSLFTHQHAFPFMSNSSMGISDPRQICNNHVHHFFSSSQLLMPAGHAFNIPPLGRHPITLPFSSKLLDSNHTGSSDHR